jgi:hypothetical protein
MTTTIRFHHIMIDIDLRTERKHAVDTENA